MIKVAADGNTGFDVAAEGGIDLILLDMRMPEPDGPAVWGRLQGDHRTWTIPVVATLERTPIRAG